MMIQNHIESETLTNYFFVEGTLDIDSKYFIDKIKKGINQEDNNNFKTNVRDLMTSYKYFNNDEKFINILKKFSKYIDSRFNTSHYALMNSWGYCVRAKHRTNFHDHKPSIWSGVIYLNSHSQCLEFPSINQKVKPEEGKFVLFSSFLNHGTIKNESEEIKWGVSFNCFPENVIVKDE